jgi:hypothetical protein
MPQPLLPFDDPPAEEPSAEPPPATAVEVASYEPSPEALAALDRLEAWLTDPRTGKASPLGREALDAVEKALVDGRNSWLHAAEDALQGLAMRNGRTHGEDIPSGQRPGEGADFHETIEELLDDLHQRVVVWGRSQR